MYSDYEKYILNIRNSLIQCGVEFPDGATQDTSDYYNLFKLCIKLEDILLFYKMLAVSGSEYMLEDFFLPLNETYKDKMRGICYIEFSTGILPDYKELTGISDEELDYDDSDVSDYQDDEDDESDVASSDDSLDLFNSMFSDDEEDIVVEDKKPDSIESKLDRVFNENKNTYDNFEYVSNGVDLDEVVGNTNDSLNETPYNSEDDDGFEWDEEDSYSSEDELDETPYTEEDEEEYYETPYAEDDEESSYYEESPYSEDDEEDYAESDYEDEYDESPYSEDEESDYEDDFDESSYEEEEESDYSEDFDESPYDEDEDINESAYGDDEEDYVDESSYSEDPDLGESNTDELKENKKGTQTKDNQEVDLGDELQDFTNSILTKLKRGAINFLNRRE